MQTPRLVPLLIAVSTALLLPLLVAPGASAGHLAPRSTEAACPADRVGTTGRPDYRDTAGTTFEREIECVTDYGIAQGRADGGYEPGKPVLRRQMALFLTRMIARSGVPLSTEGAGFTDLQGVDPAAREAIHAVAHLGVTTGVGGGRFAPDETVTRGQMASFLARAHVAVTGAELAAGADAFADDEGLGHEPAIDRVAAAGIAAGVAAGVGGADGEHRFAPTLPVTRGQMAGFLARTLAVLSEAGRMPSPYAPDSAEPTEPEPTRPTGPHSTADGVPCTLVGTDGPDVLRGTAGADVLCGLGGDDQLLGLDGRDVLDGGDGQDAVKGGPGSDDLDGGEGSDELDGEEDDNYCVPSPSDVLVRCVYDATPPELVEGSVRVTPGAVDITDADARVSLSFGLRDDTGMGNQLRMQVWLTHVPSDGSRSAGPSVPTPVRVSGTVRDGVWRADVVVQRYLPGGSYGLTISMYDRVGRHAEAEVPDVLQVVGGQPDRTAPELVSAELTADPAGDPVDVRSRLVVMTLTAHVVDAESGVADDGYLCLSRLDEAGRPTGDGSCYYGLELVSGTPQDGVWQAREAVPAQSVGGRWTAELWLRDRARSAGDVDVWRSAGQHQRLLDTGGAGERDRVLPDGVGDFDVLGVEDPDPAEVVWAEVGPDRVDTRYAVQHVRLTTRITDLDGDGVRRVAVSLAGPDGAEDLVLQSYLLYDPESGTRTDGVWTVDLEIPRGAPPGTYAVSLSVRDASHWRTFVPPEHREAGSPERTVLPGPLSVTVAPSGP